jgi:FdhD protein
MNSPSDLALDFDIVRYEAGASAEASDLLAIEEPLEIQVRTPGAQDYRSLCITMRTPGHDAELAAGFLFNEAVIRSPEQIRGISAWGPFRPELEIQNICRVDLNSATEGLGHLERHFYTNSSCGVCGRASIGALLDCAPAALPIDAPTVSASWITEMPRELRVHQEAFDATGGLHATALFAAGGEFQLAREDVGRHNAMDKAAGRLFLEGRLPASAGVLFVSGRLSFELVQKAIMMGAPILCGVGAPSSLAAQLAQKSGLTLAGFVREGRFNVYANPGRIRFGK